MNAQSSEVRDLCELIDEFYRGYPKRQPRQKPSDLIKGILYAMRKEGRANPDWISHAAHSAREILYPLISVEISEDNLIKLFREYATRRSGSSSISNQEFIDTFVELDTIYGKLSDLAHHGTAPKTLTAKEFAKFTDRDFEELIKQYIEILAHALRMQQVYVHTVIDEIVQDRRKKDLKFILDLNLDARQYFYTRADEWWLDFLWHEGFLDVIKKGANEPNVYEHVTSELSYLERIAEHRPAKVVNMIMLNVPITADTFNPEVVYRFLRICRALPADQLARVVDKMRCERWVPLLDTVYKQSGFEYEEMLKTLADAKDFESFLILAEVVLTVRAREELEGAARFNDTPFYFEYLSHTQIFALLADANAEYGERVLGLTTRKLAEIMAVSDQFLLLEVDFFTLEPGQSDGWQEDVRELAAASKALAVRLIGDRCAESGDVRRIYMDHLARLPDSRVIRRLRLFVLSLCPKAFREELKQAYFSLFEEENYYDEMDGFYFVMSGAEYLKALRTGFSVLSASDKRDFVLRTMATFRQTADVRYNGSPLLSVILPFLNEKPALKRKAEEAGFQLDPDYEPRPSINWGDGELNTITPQAPISQGEFGQLPIAEIANRLRHAWTPAELHAQNSEDDFYNPLNAEGVGDLLKNDISGRLREYVENAGLFFERGGLDPHYTYAFLMGVQEALKKDRAAASHVDLGGVIELITSIENSGTKEPFEGGLREPGWYDLWLANWDAVHSAVADVLRELLTDRDGLTPIDLGRYRVRMMELSEYLLSCPDPFPADEQGETSSSGDRDYSVNQLHQLAINSTRGRAFKAFVQFFLQDRRKFRPDEGIQISDDVKRLYARVLQKENSRALMFLFGYYLPFFYFSDRDWIRKLLPRIFSQEQAEEHLYTAAWGGILARDLYQEMFFDPEIQTLYRRGLELPDAADSPERQNYSEPGARLAQHLGHAFMHYKEFGLDHPLLEAFWNNDSPTQHAHFVNFIGRNFVYGGSSDQFFSDHPESKKRLVDFWDWLLKKDEKPGVYMEFGPWINLDKGLFEPTWLARRVRKTLKKADGVLYRDVELVKASPRLAQAAPEDTLKIAGLYLHEGGVRGKNQRVLWLWDSDNQWIEALEILYRNPSTKVGTERLINRLVVEGGRAFWPLKRLLVESP